MSSPTQRSKKLLEKSGWLVGIVEKWNPHIKIRQDLFGFADLLAVDSEHGQFVLVQTTSAGNFSSRLKKVRASDNARLWLAAGGKIYVHGWKKNSNGRWQCREEVLDVASDCADADGAG